PQAPETLEDLCADVERHCKSEFRIPFRTPTGLGLTKKAANRPARPLSRFCARMARPFEGRPARRSEQGRAEAELNAAELAALDQGDEINRENPASAPPGAGGLALRRAPPGT